MSIKINVKINSDYKNYIYVHMSNVFETKTKLKRLYNKNYTHILNNDFISKETKKFF